MGRDGRFLGKIKHGIRMRDANMSTRDQAKKTLVATFTGHEYIAERAEGDQAVLRIYIVGDENGPARLATDGPQPLMVRTRGIEADTTDSLNKFYRKHYRKMYAK